ncbi:MAG: nuclear transport factor 2 family protein [Actinomycetes bacterium]
MPELSPEQVEIKRVINLIFESFQAGDIEGMEKLLAHDCSVWDVFTPEFVIGTEARREFHEKDKAQSKARGALTWGSRFVRLDVWGDLALACYYLDFEYQEPGAMVGSVRITDVLKQINGAWQVIHHHEGLIPNPLESAH